MYPGGYSERYKEDVGVCLELIGPPGAATPRARYEIALVDQSGRGDHLVANSPREEPPLTVKRGCAVPESSLVTALGLAVFLGAVFCSCLFPVLPSLVLTAAACMLPHARFLRPRQAPRPPRRVREARGPAPAAGAQGE